MRRSLIASFFLAACLFTPACRQSPPNQLHPIVGTWFVKTPEAPFPFHMFTFHADGTMLQSNPDAGDPRTSDSNGLGVWVAEGGKVRGKFVEVTADRTTRNFVSRGEISFTLTLAGNNLSGPLTANFYDAAGKLISGPLAATLTGERVLP